MSRVELRAATLFVLIAAGGCAVQMHDASLGGAGLPSVETATAARHRHASGPPAELFVADDTGTVYVFPIQDGLPVTTPARTLDTGMGLTSLAVGSDGTTYAVSESRINIYVPGALGSDQPERTLNVAGNGAWSVAIDQQDYLYVGIFNQAVNVYAPGAQGNDQPLTSISEAGFGLVGGLALDGVGNLYVTTDAPGLSEFATPQSDPTEIRNTCFGVKSGLNGVAVAPDGTAFVAVDGSPHLDHTSYIAPVAPTESGCPVKRRRLYAVPTFLDPVGVAEFNGHIFVADAQYANKGPAIVVMDETQRGHRSPLFVLKNANFNHPRGVAVGP